MEKLNIAELLRECPTGMELDCTICDNVYFDEVTPHMIKCFVKNDVYNTIYFHHDGTYLTNQNAKCVIFPKGKTTWEGFQRPFKDGDIIYKSSIDAIAILKSNDSEKSISYVFLNILDNLYIDYCHDSDLSKWRFAIEEEKKRLFDAIKANGYKWDAETKTLEKLIEPKFKVGDVVRSKNIDMIGTISAIFSDHEEYQVTLEKGGITYILFEHQDSWELVSIKFDITTLKPFDKVLVRDNDKLYWSADIYLHHLGKDKLYQFVCIGGMMTKQCIPYESNEHLLGTTNDCDDYFKTWE